MRVVARVSQKTVEAIHKVAVATTLACGIGMDASAMQMWENYYRTVGTINGPATASHHEAETRKHLNYMNGCNSMMWASAVAGRITQSGKRSRG